MDLKELQREWDALGRADPFRAISADRCERGGCRNPDEIFASGEREISGVVELLQKLGVRLNAGIALDFGCGIGRVTEALGRRFQSAYGVDIAPSMIAEAKRPGRSETCHYMVNRRADLQIFPPDFFDFIYSTMVLQHMEPHLSLQYIGDFLRVLRPGGILVFDLPDRLRPRPSPVRFDNVAYKAEIRILAAPEEVSCGEMFEVRAAVRNASPVGWPGKQRVAEGNLIRLGNHWLTAAGEGETRDDGRTALPHDVAPNAEAELTLRVRAPMHSGSVILELDLVHEHVIWFADAGSPTERKHIAVKGTPGVESSPDQIFHGELHGVPRAEAERVIGTGGGRLLHVNESIDSSPELVLNQYIVTK